MASRLVGLAFVAVLLAAPRGARADGFMTPFIGGSGGGTITEIFDYRKNSVGYDAGGGAFVLFGAHIGARVDIRFFKSAWDAGDAIDAALDHFDLDIDPSLIPDPEPKISFTRTTFGLVFRW